MITLDNIGFEFSGRWLYRNTSLQIKPGDRIGLVGRNGTGKTTLIRLICGELRASEGTLSMAKNLKIGWLDQEMQSIESGKTVIQVALEAFQDAIQMRQDIEDLLANPQLNTDESLINELADKQQRLEAVDGYMIETKAAGILAGLGFTEHDQNQPFNSFSGGWRMRVMLAQLLLGEPDILLLDEPTNHLDIQSIQILCEALTKYEGTFIVVSHDRFFLREVANKIWYIEDQTLKEYLGSFREFEVYQSERKEASNGSAKKAKKEAAKAEKAKVSDYHADKEKRKKERMLKNAYQKAENAFMELEGKKEELLVEMAKPENAMKYEDLEKMQKQLDQLEKQITPAQDEWERLVMELEEMGIEI